MDNDFALFIDELRKSRNISRTDFVEDIVSERQYYRFIKGESSLKSETLVNLLLKLEISLPKIFKSFHVQTNFQHKELLKIYQNLYTNNEKLAYDSISKFDKHLITTDFDKKLYDFITYTSSAKLKLISMEQATNKIIELIDYPNILSKQSINIIESSGLIYISRYLFDKGDKRIASYSYDLINTIDKNAVWELNYPFYSTTAQSLGKIKEYSKCLKVCERGLVEFSNNTEINVYELLLYLQALSEKFLNKHDAYRKSLTRLFAQLYAEDNQNRFKEYEKLVEKNFNIKVSDLIKFL